MAEPAALALAYVAGHPGDAARVLEALPAEEAAAFFARVPARAGAPVLTAMLPPHAARVLAVMDPERARGLLAAGGVQGTVAILRHVPEPRRTALVEGLSTANAAASRLLLGFPEDTVGAWSDPEVIAVSSSTPANEVLERVQTNRAAQAEAVFVVGGDGRLLGSLPLPALLRGAPATTAATLMQPLAASLPAAMTLGAALAHPAWRRVSALPVVERGHRLIGVLRAAKLDEALALREEARRAEGGMTLAAVAATGYWDAVAGLAQAGIAVMPTLEPILPEGQ